MAWSVCTNMLELLLDVTSAEERKVLTELLAKGDRNTINQIMYSLMEREPLMDWGMHHGFYNMGVDNPYDYMLAANRYEYKEVAHKITQDFLLLGAEKEHLIRIGKYKDVIDGLINVKSQNDKKPSIAILYFNTTWRKVNDKKKILMLK